MSRLHEELSEARAEQADMMNAAKRGVPAWEQFGLLGCLRAARNRERILEILKEMRNGY